MKLERPNERELEALASIEGREWSVIEDWLARSMTTGDEQLRSSRDEIDVRQWQGALQALNEFLEHQRGAREAIRRLHATS